MTLVALIAEIIDASYPLRERWEARQAAADYLVWLETIPTLEAPRTRR